MRCFVVQLFFFFLGQGDRKISAIYFDEVNFRRYESARMRKTLYHLPPSRIIMNKYKTRVDDS